MKIEHTVNVYIRHAEFSQNLDILRELLCLGQKGDKIMTVIKDYADQQSQHNSRLEGAFNGLTGDIKQLNDLILQLKQTQGNISEEDRQVLNALQIQGQSLADRFSSLDAQTPNETQSDGEIIPTNPGELQARTQKTDFTTEAASNRGGAATNVTNEKNADTVNAGRQFIVGNAGKNQSENPDNHSTGSRNSVDLNNHGLGKDHKDKGHL